MFKKIGNFVLVKVQEQGDSYSIMKDVIGYNNKLEQQLQERIVGDETNAIRMYNLPNWNYKPIGKLSLLTDESIGNLQDYRQEGFVDFTIESFNELLLTEGWSYRPEETMVLGEVELCKKCNNKIANWYYMPAGDDDRYFCDDCVYRGCSCNRYYSADLLDPDGDFNVKYFDENEEETTKESTWTYFVYVDEDGKQFPCCEYTYEEEGFLI